MTIRRQAKDLQNSTNILFSKRVCNIQRIHSRVPCLIGLPELFKIGLPKLQEAQLVLCGFAIALTT